MIRPEAETVLRDLGEQGDIIKRMHRALSGQGIERGVSDYIFAGEADGPVLGRLVERGHDDELKGTASGATWLDRQAVSRDPVELSNAGFGIEVRQAMKRRAEHLIEEGLAERQGNRVVFAGRLLDRLRDREVGDVAERFSHSVKTFGFARTAA